MPGRDDTTWRITRGMIKESRRLITTAQSNYDAGKYSEEDKQVHAVMNAQRMGAAIPLGFAAGMGLDNGDRYMLFIYDFFHKAGLAKTVVYKAAPPAEVAPFAWTCSQCTLSNSLLTPKCGACESPETKIRFTAMQKWVSGKSPAPADPETCPIALTYRAINVILRSQ